MTLLYSDGLFLEHETGPHPESANRMRLIEPRLESLGLLEKCRRPKWEPATWQRLMWVHAPHYIDEIRAVCRSGGGDLDVDTVASPASYEVALAAVGAVCDATERLVRGEDTQAVCLVRPPGHHALASRAMGFCLFNNVAVAAQVAIQELGLDRVLIVDWDVHHGNGTQATFWEEPRVGFLSIHRWPFYPGTGEEDETGSGAGLGTTLNLPVSLGIARSDYLTVFGAQLEKFCSRMRPQIVLVSAGFDAHRRDPVGNLGLETEDYAKLTDLVLDAAEAYAGGKLISVLEGGYDPAATADSVSLHVERMLRRSTISNEHGSQDS